MITVNYDDLIAKMKEHQATLGDGRDCRSENELAQYRAAYDSAQRHVTALMNLPADVAREQVKLDAVVAKRAAHLAKRAALEQAIAEAPDYSSIHDARAGDREADRQQLLRQWLVMLADGVLYSGPGVCFERLADLDERIRQLTERRDREQAKLDFHVRAAEQLLGATATFRAKGTVSAGGSPA